jgi:hypothetical protein
VIAFEPVVVTFEVLAANVGRLPLRNVTLLNVAAAATVRVSGMAVPKWLPSAALRLRFPYPGHGPSGCRARPPNWGAVSAGLQPSTDVAEPGVFPRPAARRPGQLVSGYAPATLAGGTKEAISTSFALLLREQTDCKGAIPEESLMTSGTQVPE